MCPSLNSQTTDHTKNDEFSPYFLLLFWLEINIFNIFFRTSHFYKKFITLGKFEACENDFLSMYKWDVKTFLTPKVKAV